MMLEIGLMDTEERMNELDLDHDEEDQELVYSAKDDEEPRRLK